MGSLVRRGVTWDEFNLKDSEGFVGMGAVGWKRREGDKERELFRGRVEKKEVLGRGTG